MISFIHGGNESMASYRYRVKTPAKYLNTAINDLSADVVIFSKPQKEEVEIAKAIKNDGRKVIVDFCDDHFEWDYYRDLLKIADRVTCPTEKMQEIILSYGREATVIHDPYEYPLMLPHCNGNSVLWYGHGTNINSLIRVLGSLKCHLRVVSNVEGAIPWTWETMLREFLMADIVIMPATKAYKSPNRTIEAIRQGCFVVAEPHPAINDFPGIWIGDIEEGIEWAANNSQEANQRTRLAQKYIENFSPERTGNAWKRLVTELGSISDVEIKTGLAG